MANVGRVDKALVELSRFPMPGFFWYHAHMAWFHVELGNMEAAREEAATMLALYPTFEAHAYAELALQCYDELRDRAIAAWRKAGLTITPSDQIGATERKAGQ